MDGEKKKRKNKRLKWVTKFTWAAINIPGCSAKIKCTLSILVGHAVYTLYSSSCPCVLLQSNQTVLTGMFQRSRKEKTPTFTVSDAPVALLCTRHFIIMCFIYLIFWSRAVLWP